MSHPAPETPSAPAPRSAVTRFLDAVERIGNKLPDPAMLFLILMLLTWAVSAVLSGWSFTEIDPRSGDPVAVNNLLSGASLTEFMATMVQTFVNFAPLGVVFVAIGTVYLMLVRRFLLPDLGVPEMETDGHGGAYYTQGGLFHAKADGTVDTIVAAGNPQQGGVFTNGLVLSPDGKRLYVTNRTTILAFDVGPDGALSNRRDFATMEGEPQGSFGGDGLAIDADGRLYVTGGAGIYVFDTTGQQLGVIPTPRRAITATFGGPERKTLYIGTLGANTPTGENWQTPQGVRNIAATIYAVPTLAVGIRR